MHKAGKPHLAVEPLEARDVPAVTATLSGTSLVVEGTNGNDSIVVRQDGSRVTVDGLNIRDRWTDVSGVDVSRVRQVVVRAQGGNDTVNLTTLQVPTLVWGGSGNDRIYGGSGHDVVYGDQGADTIVGGAGDDWLVGGDESDQVWGGAGNDWITGDGGDDFLSGDEGDDSLSGGDGRDTLSGGAGDDQLNGHGFGIGLADARQNFDTYRDDFDLWHPAATGAGPATPLQKGELDDPGYLSALSALGPADVRAAIRVVTRGTYDVYLAGDRRTVRVTFDGSWTDNDPKPAGGSAPDFSLILMHRARLIALGLDPNRYYSNADWDALNARTGGRLYDPADALRQFTGRGVARSTPAQADFDALKAKLDQGAAAVAYSFHSATRTANPAGVMGNTDYAVRRLFTDSSGRKWVELYNPLGTDSGNGRLMDNAPGAVKMNDGVVTLTWDDFRRSSNFTALVVA